MAKRGIVEAIDCEFELPEHIIQRIQSFLTGKAAARTTVLSKSWHKAWLTRPNIDLDYEELCPNYDGFLELANNTIQRYEESNLKIESFRLLFWLEDYNSDLVNTLILKALKLCAHHLSFQIKQRRRGEFVIAREVFEIENLLGLSLEECGIDIGMDHNVRCSKLQSLSLSCVEIHNPGVIFQIISSCPLIENLSLSYIFKKEGFRKYEPPINLLKMHNLKRLVLSDVELDTLFFRDMSSKFPSLKDLILEKLSVGGCTFDVGMDQNVRCSRLKSLSLYSVEIESRDMISKIILSCPLIENMSLSEIRDKKYYERPVISVPISLPKLHNIKCLVLCYVHFDTLFLSDLSSKFPFLKDLTLSGIWRSDEEVVEIQISSHSLEHLNLTHNRGVKFEFDVPSIRKLTFECHFIPLVSFKSTSSDWESHVSINYYNDRLGTSWFLGLNELLTALIPSKIYLSINGIFKTCFGYEVGDIQGFPQAEVENLAVDIRHLPTLNCYVLFDGIFRACRPKFVTQYLLPDSYSVGKTNCDFLCKRLAQGVDGEFSHPRNFMYGLNGLKEVNVQVFDEFVAVWKDLPCKSLLEASESPEEKKIIRFQLGDQTYFEIEPPFGVEASELYPDVKYTTVDEYLDRFV